MQPVLVVHILNGSQLKCLVLPKVHLQLVEREGQGLFDAQRWQGLAVGSSMEVVDANAVIHRHRGMLVADVHPTA